MLMKAIIAEKSISYALLEILPGIGGSAVSQFFTTTKLYANRNFEGINLIKTHKVY